MELIDSYRLSAVMATEADTPVIDLTNRVGDDMTAAVGSGAGKVGRIIGGRVSTALVKGQDSHLVTCPTSRGLRSDMTLFTRQMRRDAASRRGLLEVSAAYLIARIGMTKLALTDQGMGIGGMMYACHSRRMADRTESTAIIC